jgi:UDP-N-acetyl-D-mannosaminuronate dehydrogenase
VKVSIIGQGYVGLTISVFAADHHNVVGFDKNQGVVDALNAGKSHIEGVESADLARQLADKYKRLLMLQILLDLMWLLLQYQHR